MLDKNLYSKRELEAADILENYFKSKGVTEASLLMITDNKDGSVEFQVLKPYGIFIVRADDTVDDNYQVFDRR